MSTPAEELATKLAQFERLHPVEGARLRSMVNGSPELSALLENAVAKGHLDGGFQLLSDADRRAGKLGTYAADSETLSLPKDLLRSSNSRDTNTLLSAIGHEATHAINKIDRQQSVKQFNNDLASVAASPPPRDYTAAIKGFLDNARTLEATAEIGGVNVLAAQIKRDNPGATQAQLYEKLFDSTKDVQGYFDVTVIDGHKTYTPKPGITFNDQFQIEPNRSNVAAFGQHFFDARGYPADYGQRVIDDVTIVEAKALAAEAAKHTTRPSKPATLDLKALGIDPGDVTLPSSLVDGTSPRLTAPVSGTTAPTVTNPQTDVEARAGADALPARSRVAPLSTTSDALLRDSERFVRQIAEKHHLGWDAGMDNTVYATASSAREAGMTAITHFKVSDGTLRFAQQDGYGLKEASLDARVAANTPATQSVERLEALDHAARTPSPYQAPQRTLEPALAQAR